jgi:hypothetical protein
MDNRRRTLNDNTSLRHFGLFSLHAYFQIGKHHTHIQKQISIFVRFTRVLGKTKFFILLVSLLFLIYQTLFLVVFEYVYDVYLFENKHVCKLNRPKWRREVLSFSVRRLLSITFIIL